VSKKAVHIMDWITWIVLGNHPFTFVSDPYTRKYSNLSSISVNTLKKYMGKLIRVVEDNISKLLPSIFGISLDGWTDGSINTHFVALFAVFSKDNMNEWI
jgi:hypothetical protein